MITKFLGWATLALILFVSYPAFAQTHWTGSLSENWFDDGNWTDGIPQPDKNVHLNSLAPNPTVLNALDGESLHLYAGFSASGSLTIDNAGTLVSSGATLGNSDSADGIVRVTGAGSSWTLGGSYFEIGKFGSGELIIENAGQVLSSGLGGFGRHAGSFGRATVTGLGSIWQSASMYVGWTDTGELTINDGGQVFFNSGADGRFEIGHGTNSRGQVVVTGAGSMLATSQGSVNIGASGSGSLLLTGQAMLAVQGTGSQRSIIHIARLSSATGTLTVGAVTGEPPVEPGQIDVRTLRFGEGVGSAVFNHTGSLLVPANVLGPFASGTAELSFLSGITLFSGTAGSINGEEFDFSGTTSIAAGATLGAAGTVGETTNMGTLQTGFDGLGTLVVDSNYVHGPTAELHIAIGAASASGLVEITGTADLQGGVVSVSLAPGSYPQPLDNGLYPILTAAGGISGQFNGLAAGSISNGIALVHDSDTIYLDVHDGLFSDRLSQ